METRRALYLASALGLALSACKRGALADLLGVRRDEAPAISPQPSPTSAFQLKSVDCPDGLARCVNGVVESSRAAHIAQPCTAGGAQCACPWDFAADCERGCEDEGLVVVTSPERAAVQLCAQDPSQPNNRPAPGLAAPDGACEEAGYRCVKSLVVACTEDTTGARVVAACLRGCGKEGDSLGEEESDPARAARILCAP